MNKRQALKELREMMEVDCPLYNSGLVHCDMTCPFGKHYDHECLLRVAIREK